MPLIRGDFAKYWEIPDGTNCIGKAWFAGRVGAAVGMIGSVYHVVLSDSAPALKTAQVVATGTVTMATIAAVFGLSTCFSAHITEKPDHPMNYFIGGCTSGILFGARAHSITTGASACVGLGVVAALVKISKTEGWAWAPEPKM